METLVHAIRQLQTGALARTEFYARLDHVLEATPGSGGRLLEVLSEEHARAPLAPELYSEVQRRIQRLMESRQRMGADDTVVQTKPGAYATSPSRPPLGTPDEPAVAEPERMKAVGDTLNGRFVLEECIGFGGMGTVYKALDLRKLEASDRKPYIAIKVLNVQFRGHPKSLVALQREARKAQTLAHPNIVSVYDFDRDGSMVYLTMEYLAGKPLSQVLRAPDFKGLPYAETMRIVSGMASALAYAHERGFVHCDFKPANVILTDSGKVKVIDFGIARVFQKAEEEVDVTVFDPGSLGALTPAYASPEMLEHREPDPRDDIYALACITYELLSGRHPFNRMSAAQAHAAGMKPQRPASLARSKWRGLRCALSFERETRTPTVARFLSQVGETGHGLRSTLLAASGMAAAALGIGAAVHFWPRPDTDSEPRAAATAAPQASIPAPQAPAPQAPAVQASAVQASAPQASAPQASAPQASAPQAPAPPPAAAPAASALPAVAAALARVPCSALFATEQSHAVTVHGYLSRSIGNANLRAILGAIPGVATLNLDVQPVDNDKCGVITTFAPYWAAYRRAGGGATIRLSAPHAGTASMLTEGDPLKVDVSTGAAESYVTVDYFALDGNVAHLLPNLRARANRMPAGHTATIGSAGTWLIGKPFGSELVVLVSTPVPLFDGLRPESEPGAAYLSSVAAQLAQISARSGADTIAVDFVQINTRPR